MRTVVWSSGESLVAIERNLVVARWYGAPTGAQLRALRDALEAVGASHPGRGGLLNVIVGGGAPRFDDAILGEVARFSREEIREHLGVAHVVLARGVAGVAIRSVLGSIHAVARPRSPMRSFDDLDAAATWLAERLSVGVPWSGYEVRRAGQLPAAGVDRHAATAG